MKGMSNRHSRVHFVIYLITLVGVNCANQSQYDLVIRNGTIYDGEGSLPFVADVGVRGDVVEAVGFLGVGGRLEIDASGRVVAPGFINMLSWATETLIEDGRSQSDIRQGVTLEVFGEGWSMGPYSELMKKEQLSRQGDIRYDVLWRTLFEYLDHLVDLGISTNVASFVGATTVRVHVLNHEDRAPTPRELQRMQALVREAMEEGALGIGSSLIYAPAFYATTEELIALCRTASAYGGMYISHIRSEGDRLLEAVDELVTISREADIPAEIYHFKAAGQSNWDKLEVAIQKIESARAEGLSITADVYLYTAGSTGLDAAMPPWVQEGGHRAWMERLKDPDIRRRVQHEMATPSEAWENLLLLAGSADNVLLVSFKSDALKPLTGKSLAEVAAARDRSPEETAIDLVIEDNSRVGSVYFLMSEENLRKKVSLPWVSFGSDAGSLAPEGVFLKSNPHPRAYGNFSRLLGNYVREEGILSLQEAIRRLTSLPASNLKLNRRGSLKPGFFADIVVLDPAAIRDHATFDCPHQYSTGVIHVFVNGVQVLRDGEHTGATPGRVIRGPGWKGHKP